MVTAVDGSGAYGPVSGFELADAKALVDVKLMGPWLVAKHAGERLRPGGSLVFTSGIAAYRPAPGGSMVASVNAALEGLVRALALELAPVRVNAVSPGWVDTPVWEAIAGPDKDERLKAMAERLPVGRIGAPEEIAHAFLALLRNGFVTGSVMHVDGGHRLV